MSRTKTIPYRALLLASVAGTVLGNVAQGQTITNSATLSSQTASVILSGGTSAVNTSSGVIILQNGAAAGSAAVLAGVGTIAAITNNGVVQAGAASGIGIHVTSGGSVGTITNSGTVTATAAGASAIVIDAASNVGTLINSDQILASGDGGSGVSIASGASVTTLNNMTTGTIQASGSAGVGINVAGGLGTLLNAGLISAPGTAGIAVNVAAGGTLGAITNNSGGTISATGTSGVAIDVAGSIGSIVNTGLIQGSTLSGSQGALGITGTGSVGSIANNSGGTIGSSSYSAVDVAGHLGTLTNNGLLATTGGTANDALYVESTGTVGTITNGATGTIQANTYAVEDKGSIAALSNSGLIQATGSSGTAVVLDGGSLGTLTNSGTILSSSGVGIALSAAGSITSGITNTASGLIQGGPSNGSGVAINNATSNQLTINTTGSIVGAIKLGSGGDTLNVTGGAITGNIVGQSGSGDSLIVTVGSSGVFTTGNTISGIDTFTVNSGTLANIGSILGAVTLAAGPNALSNSGLINAGTSAVAVSLTGAATLLSNSGSIIATGGTAISLGSGASIAGGITNTASGLIQGGDTTGSGVAIDHSAGTSALALANSGTILGQVKLGGPGDTLTNSNLISSTASAAVVVSGTIGGITNSGTIIDPSGTAIKIATGGSIAGGITNTASGLIEGGPSNGSGVAIDNTTNTSPPLINNNGTIIGAIKLGTGTSTLNILGTGTIIGAVIGNSAGNDTVNFNPGSASLYTLSNPITGITTGSIVSGSLAIASSGSIVASGTALLVTNTIGSIVNSGLINGGVAGISTGSTGKIAGGITNTASGLIQGGPSGGSGVAIDNSANANQLTINNAGSVVGAIKLGSGGDTLNVTGGAITGNITGQSGSGDSLIVTLGSTGVFTTGNTVSGIDNFVVNSGTLANTGSILGAVTLATGPNALTNSGLINAGTSATAVSVTGATTLLSNSGSIVATGGTAISTGSTGKISGGITNTASGLIQGGPSVGSGVAINNAANANKLTINNAGSVVGAIKLGSGGDTLNVTGGAITGNIVGQSGSGDSLIVTLGSSGVFTTGNTVSGIDNFVVNSGTLANTGSILGAVTLATGPNALTNSGLINAGTSATAVSVTGATTLLSNSGSIVATGGTAISTGSTGKISGGITNTASGLIQGGPSVGSGVAINNAANANKLTINNAGSIVGAIKLGSGGDTLNVTGGAITGNIVGQSGSGDSLILTLGSNGVFAAGNTISGIDTFTVNSGTLANTGSILGAVTLAAGPNALTNSGLINAGTSAVAVSVTGATTLLSNSGSIIATGGTAISLGSGAAITGGITNTASGLIQGGNSSGSGVAIDHSAGTSALAVNNSGTILGQINLGGPGDTLTNSNLISAAASAAVVVGGTIGSITNSGTIIDLTGTAIKIAAGGSLVGGITNTASGLIEGGPSNGSGVAIDNTTNTSPPLINNNGTIIGAIKLGTGTSTLNILGTGTIIGAVIGNSAGNDTVNFNPGAGNLYTLSNPITGITTGSIVSGSLAITPSGSIVASGTALLVTNTIGSIVNSGLINGGSVGISTDTTGKIAGGITNTASGLIQGGAANGSGVAIDNSANANQLTINNAGSIVGAIKFGSGGDTLNVTGGAITGNITGQSGSGDSLIVTLGSTGVFTTGNTISGIDSFVVNTGTLANTGSILGSVTLATGPNALTNSGLISSPGTAIIAAGTVGSVTNSGTIQSTGSSGVAINVSGSVGSIANSGLIQGSTLSGGTQGALGITSSGTVGSITNNAGGTIGSSSYSAVDVAGHLGTLTNNGLLATTGGSTNDALYVESTGTAGTITNGATGTIQSNTPVGYAVEVTGTIAALNNSGLIQALGSNGSAIVVDGGRLGALTNSGTIQSSAVAIALTGAGNVTSGITNTASGLIQGGPSNGSGVAINNAGSSQLTINNAGSIIGAINFGSGGDTLNVTGGAITGNIVGQSGSGDSLIVTLGSSGVFTTGNTISGIDNFVLNTGTLANTGSILGAVTLATGPNALTNSGLINAGNSAVAVSVTGAATLLSNSGSIIATGGTAISTGSTGSIAGGITNTASGLIQGGPPNGSGVAIDNSANANPLTINSAGSIVGAIKLGSGGDTVNITGGAVSGNIVGQSGSGDSLILAVGQNGVWTEANTITGIDNFVVNSGTLANPGAIYGAVTLAAGPNALTNSGLIYAGTSAVAVSVTGLTTSLSNSGSIIATGGTAISVASGATIVNGITNTASGLIQGGDSSGSGVAIDHSAGSSALAVANSGTILGQIKLGGPGDTLSNSNLISSSASAAVVVNGTIGSITNSGTIIDPSGTAIQIVTGGSIAGGITNTASGLIEGGPSNGSGVAIDNTTNTLPPLINNNGTIIGAIKLGTGTSTLNILGTGTVIGAVIGNPAGNDTVTFNPGSASLYTLSNPITGITTGSIVSGSLAITPAGSIVASGTALSVTNTIGSIVNSGLINGGAAGISTGSTGNIVGGITNTANGLIQGGPSNGSGVAIDNSANANQLVINNAGSIVGAVKLGAGRDTLNVTGGAITGNITGQSGRGDSLIVTVGSNGVFTTGNTVSGIDKFVVNTGTLANTGSILGAVTLAAGPNTLANSGLINAGASATAVSVNGTTTLLSNSGSIIATSGTAVALASGATIVGGITNTANGLIQGGASDGSGVAINNAGNANRLTVNNAGSIVGAIQLGSGGDTVNVTGGAITGNITGQSGSGDSLIVAVGSSGVFNTGNTVSGIDHFIVQNGTLANSGAILGTVTLAAGPNALANSGLISTSATAVSVNGATTVLSNSGSIVATSGTAIALASGATITNGITNTASGLIQGGPSSGSGVAISNAANANPLTINNAGSIVGGINFGSGADVLNITGGGTVVGTVTGQSGSGAAVNFGPAGTYTLNNIIASVDTVNVASGAINVQSFGSVTTPITGAKAFNIASGASVIWNSGTVQATQLTNSGLLNIGTATPTLNGSYQQTSSGQLAVTVNNTTNGVLTATGSATVAGAANAIIVNVPVTLTRNLYGVALPILNAGSVVVSSSASLTATVVGDPFIMFNVEDTGTSLELVGATPSGSQIEAAVQTQLNAIFGTGNAGLASLGFTGTGEQNAASTEAALLGLLVHLAGIGDTADYGKIIFALTDPPTSAQINQFLAQLQPSMVVNAQLLLGSVLSLDNGANAAVSNRLATARSGSGLEAEDAVGRGYVAWAQPFGSFLTQDQKQGVEGFSANAYGAAFGADMLVRPDLRVGLSFSLGNSDISFNQNLSGNTATIFNTQVAAYGSWFRDGFFVDGLLGGGFNRYTTRDYVSLLASSRDAGFNGTQITARLGGGYDWHLPSGVTVTPGLSLQETHYNVNGYTTTGGLGPLNLAVNSKGLDVLQSRIGARASYAFPPVNGFIFAPEAHAYYIHNYGTDAVTTTATFTGGGPAFNTSSASRDQDEFNVGLGLTVARLGPVILSGEYDYTGGASAHDHTIFFRFKTEF